MDNFNSGRIPASREEVGMKSRPLIRAIDNLELLWEGVPALQILFLIDRQVPVRREHIFVCGQLELDSLLLQNGRYIGWVGKEWDQMGSNSL